MADDASEVEARRRESKEMLAVALKDDQLWSAIRRVFDDALVGDFQFSGNVHVSFCDLLFSINELRGELWSWAKEPISERPCSKFPESAVEDEAAIAASIRKLFEFRLSRFRRTSPSMR